MVVVVGHEGVDDQTGMSRFSGAAATVVLLHGEDPLECVSEICVEDRVDHRVERRVGVAEPGQDLEGQRRDALLADPVNYIHDEERGPVKENI